jgi:hypothetical protein
MLAQVDGMMVGGALAALALLGYVRHLARNPTDKVEARPAAPRGSAPGWLSDLRRRARGWRELRASRRRAAVIARIQLEQRRPE